MSTLRSMSPPAVPASLPCAGRLASLLLVLAASTACAPPFSELQSARLAGRGRVEVTPSYSDVRFSGEGETEKVQSQFGVQLGTGIAEKADLRLRLERISVSEDGEDVEVYVVGGGPKFALVPDRVAFYLPVGFAFGSDIETSETFQTHPTLIGTLPLSRGLDVTGSTKALVPLGNDHDITVAFNLGLGIGEGISPVVLRPEVGMLINPGEEGRFWHFSLGLSYAGGQPR